MRLMIYAAIAALALAAAAGAAEPGTDSAQPQTYEIGSPIPEKRVAVMDLRVSGDYADQVKSWLPALIEDRLLKEGWTLLVRGERLQHIQAEHNLPDIKPETKLPANEILGATAFIELAARVQVKDIQGAIGYKMFSLGDFARASVDLYAQIVDPATGVLKSSTNVGGSASGVKTALVVSIGSDWRIGAGGYNLRGIRESLVGKAADTAAAKLIDKLKCLYPSMPAQKLAPAATAMQPASTTVTVENPPTILMELPDSAAASPGDRYGVFRGADLIAEVEIIRVFGKRAEAKIISQTGAIKSTDTARRMPLVIKAE